MKLARLISNPFWRPGVSLAEMLAFATDAKERLVSGNEGGRWDGVIAGLVAALANVSGAAGGNLAHLGKRKAAKMTKRQFRAEMGRKVARIHAGLVAVYGPRSAAVRSVFPEGRRELLRRRDDQLGPALGSLTEAVFALSGAMGPLGSMALGLAQELRDGWAPLYHASEESSAKKAVSESGLRQARARLAAELHRALLTVGLHFVSEAAAAGRVLSRKEAEAHRARYFREDLLRIRRRPRQS